jgi:hypothetical protein
MDSAKLSDWMQVIGIFALVVSLVFVGLQMQQDHEIARATIYQDRAALGVENMRAMASNRAQLELKIEFDGYDPDEPASSDRWGQSITMMELYGLVFQQYSSLIIMDNDFFQYEIGLLPEDHWEAVRAGMKFNISENRVARFVVEREINIGNELRPVFLNELREIIREIDEGEST